MNPTFNQATAYTLKEISQFFDKNGKFYPFINMLAQDNPFLDHMMYKMGNQSDGHKSVIVTSLPEVHLRSLYQGTPTSKGGFAQVKDVCRQLAARFAIDADLLKDYTEDKAKNALRLQHGKLHIESMKQTAASYMFYGNNNVNADEWLGLAPRYNALGAGNVVNAEGKTPDKQTSIWGVVFGDTEVHGIYPSGSKAGLYHRDLGSHDAFDEKGDAYEAYGDEWKWNLGLTVCDWRSVVRLGNIDTTKLLITDPKQEGFVDLQGLGVIAKNKIKSGIRPRMKWYCSETVLTALELQALKSPSVHLHYGQYMDSKEQLMFHGKPIYQCDAILETEEVLA